MGNIHWQRCFLLSGGTGLIGSALLERITREGGSAYVWSRSPSKYTSSSSFSSRVTFISSLDSIPDHVVIDVVINLAGEPIAAKRWTAQQKARLLQSRIRTTSQLADFISSRPTKPSYFFSASAIGFYGDHGEQFVDESSEQHACFSSELCHRWEVVAQTAAINVPIGIGRFGVVLAKSGGSWAEFVKPLLFKVSPVFSNGRQWFSWVALEDVVDAIGHMFSHTLTGAYNITAPEPVTNGHLSLTLKREGGALIRPTIPAVALRLMLGEMADELLLCSQRVLPKALLDSGFDFKQSSFDAYVKQLLA